MGQMTTQLNQAQSQNSDKLPSQTVQNPKNVSAITLRFGKQIEVPPPVAAPTPEPVKLHSTPEKEDELAAQKRKLPDHEGANKIFMQVDLFLVVLTCSTLLSLFHFHLEQFQTKKWKKWKTRS